MHISRLGFLILSIGVVGCTTRGAEKPPGKPPEVLVTAAVSAPITDFEAFTGRTEAKNTIEVKARVTGYLDKVLFKDGATVKEGDVLFEIDPRPYEIELRRADANLIKGEAKAKRAEADFRRAEMAKQSKSISPEKFDEISGDRNLAKADLDVIRADVARARLNLLYTKVIVPTLDNGKPADPKQPRLGQVSRRMKDPGNLIKADETMLTTIVTHDPMYVYFDVDERTVLRLRALIAQKKIKSVNEMTFDFELANDEGTYPHAGQISFEDNRLDAGTGTLQLRGEFKNTKGLAPGLFVRLRLYIGAPRTAVLVPERALGTDQGQKFLYLVKKETDKEGKVMHKAEYRGGADLELGALRDGWRVVEKGVNAGDIVIWSGLQRVRKDATISPKDQAAPGRPAVKDAKSVEAPKG
ncbi:MAG: efflux RND transporter periplasmic adaptor subunit [Planctomycetes bacterium]|nr:efflux RND transporter periplasmic adaptor subunit [Planctomycetota bacterium]